MADFCNKCGAWMFGPNHVDIDLIEMFNKGLKDKPNYNPETHVGFLMDGFLCEGCGCNAIAKINDKLHIHIPVDNTFEKWEWIDYETFNPDKKFKDKF